MAVKTCTGCRRLLPATSDHFTRDRSKADGWHTRCRECRGRAKPTLEERFWLKVHMSYGCWEWTGGTATNCYGVFWTGGPKGVGRLTRAHRFSYQLIHGAIADDVHVLHKCDNPRCVRPDHLELGDAAKNLRDAALRLRTARGVRHGMAKLTEDQVLEIRSLLAERMSQERIASRFGVSRGAIQEIAEGRNWAWL